MSELSREQVERRLESVLTGGGFLREAAGLARTLAPAVAAMLDEARAEVVRDHPRDMSGDCRCGWKYHRDAPDMLGQYQRHVSAAAGAP